MSARRLQDIPIRPRYGLCDDGEERTTSSTTTRTRKTSSSSATNGSDQMAASYTEIPFLAQYADGGGPKDLTPTPERRNSELGTKQRNDIHDHDEEDVAADADDDADDDEDDDEDDDDYMNSKDSSGDDNKTPRRPNSLHCDSSFPYELDAGTGTRTASNDGEMRHFVADNLEDTLRTATPSARPYGSASQNSTPSGGIATAATLQHFLGGGALPQIDANVLADIELEAQYLSASVDNLLENLCSLLHSISSITADNVEVHKNAVNKLTDSMDANIKCMYTIMAKTEEITKTMRPIEQLGHRIREIKRLVEMLDNAM